jgi:hypothetical protein
MWLTLIVPFAVDQGHLHTGLTSPMYAGYGTGGEHVGGTHGKCFLAVLISMLAHPESN